MQKEEYKGSKERLDEIKTSEELAGALYELGLQKLFSLNDSDDMYDLRVVFETSEGKHEYSWKERDRKLGEED